MDVRRDDELPGQRAVGARGDLDVGPPHELEHPERVRRGLLEGLVPVRRRHSEHLHFRAGEREVFSRVPGGKGANQAVACARLGAEVTLVGAVGSDSFADEALAGLREAGVELELLVVDEPTGVAVILVDVSGENQIVVAPGANSMLGEVELPRHDAVLCQLEIVDEAVLSAWEQCAGFFCLNAAPARPMAVDADLTVVNRYELESLSRRDGLVAVTLGVEGAVLLEDGEEIARAAPPAAEAVDGTAAGDAFTACLLVSLLEQRKPDEALTRACAAGALAASRFGAQPSLPTADEIDAILA